MNEDEKRHEDKCKELFELYFYKLASDGTNDGELTHISDRFDGLVKIEDFAVKWREANHAWVKVWAPIFSFLPSRPEHDVDLPFGKEEDAGRHRAQGGSGETRRNQD